MKGFYQLPLLKVIILWFLVNSEQSHKHVRNITDLRAIENYLDGYLERTGGQHSGLWRWLKAWVDRELDSWRVLCLFKVSDDTLAKWLKERAKS